MKINKRFAVKVEDKIFKADEMTKISIEGGRVNIVCSYCNGSLITINARTGECEFLEDPQIPTLAQGGAVTGRDMAYTYHEYCKVGDEPASDIEIVSPSEELKKAFNEAIKEMGQNPKTIQVGLTIDGKQFAKAIKPGDAIRKGVVADMTERNKAIDDAARKWRESMNLLQIDLTSWSREVSEIIKKYNHTGGD